MSEVGRKSTITVSVILSLIGMGLSIAAIMTPSWQVVNLREYNSIHEHGLWLDCTRHTRDGNVLLRRFATVTEPLHCVYKFDYDKYSGTFDLEDDNSPVGEVNRHKFYGWHTATLVLLALALLTSFMSICIGICGCCYGSLSLVFTAIMLITTFLSCVAEGLFFFYSHRADNRFIKGLVGTYEQRVGLAFFLQMGACAFHFFSFLVAVIATYFSFTVKGGVLDNYSVQRSSRTNMTNIGRTPSFDDLLMSSDQRDSNFRSMDFDSQQFSGFQQNPNKPKTTPYYIKNEFSGFDSMPELAHARSYQSDLNPPQRIRRKSETCV